jgi:hypothetical protein
LVYGTGKTKHERQNKSITQRRQGAKTRKIRQKNWEQKNEKEGIFVVLISGRRLKSYPTLFAALRLCVIPFSE